MSITLEVKLPTRQLLTPEEKDKLIWAVYNAVKAQLNDPDMELDFIPSDQIVVQQST